VLEKVGTTFRYKSARDNNASGPNHTPPVISDCSYQEDGTRRSSGDRRDSHENAQKSGDRPR
jgi:hypothetical protein